MATIFKRGDCWVLRFTRDGRHTSKSLGKISKEAAQRALESYSEGNIPSNRRESIPIKDHEIFEIHRRSWNRAKEREIPHTLTRNETMELFKRSGGKCEVTGIRFDRTKPRGCTKRPWFPSIDRIDSRGPYSKDNCRFVCVAVNISLGEWGEETLIRLSKALVLGNYAEITPK